MDNHTGLDIMNDIGGIIDRAKYYLSVTADSSVAEELYVIIDCLNRAFEAAMNLSKLDVN